MQDFWPFCMYIILCMYKMSIYTFNTIQVMCCYIMCIIHSRNSGKFCYFSIDSLAMVLSLHDTCSAKKVIDYLNCTVMS